MKILITGGAGFIGSHLARYCQKLGHTVAIIDRDFSKHPMSDIEFKLKTDLTVYDSEFEIFFDAIKPDVCFHLAAYASEGRSNHIREFITRNNTLTTMRVTNLCVRHNVALVFTSSVAVYSGDKGFGDFSVPQPIDEYGLSKYMSELSLEIAHARQGLRYTIVRPRNVYGPGQNLWDPTRNLFGIWMYNAIHGKDCLIYGDGEQVRQFTYIDDLIPCLFRAHEYGNYGYAFNLGALKSYTINEARDAFVAVTGYNQFRYIEPRHEVKIATCMTGMSEYKLGWNIEKETKLRDGLTKMWEWARQQPDRSLDPKPMLEVTVNVHSSL